LKSPKAKIVHENLPRKYPTQKRAGKESLSSNLSITQNVKLIEHLVGMRNSSTLELLESLLFKFCLTVRTSMHLFFLDTTYFE
jgi:hypothetical protein